MEKLYKASDIIRAIDKHTKDTPHGLVLDEDITIILEEMKSVEPDASDCWGCNCPKMERKTFSEMVHLHDAETHDKRTGTHGVCLDTISRQEAIDEAFEVYLDGERFEVVQVETLMGLPSATCRNLEKPEKPQHSEGEAADCNLDCIGRQAAIEAVRKCSVKEVTPAFMLVDKAEVMTELMMLPSAQPEPCGDTISREYLKEHIKACWINGRPMHAPELNELLSWIDDVPSVQPKIIHCLDCVYGEQDDIGRWFCTSLACQVGDEDGSGFCADAERRTDG